MGYISDSPLCPNNLNQVTQRELFDVFRFSIRSNCDLIVIKEVVAKLLSSMSNFIEKSCKDEEKNDFRASLAIEKLVVAFVDGNIDDAYTYIQNFFAIMESAAAKEEEHRFLVSALIWKARIMRKKSKLDYAKHLCIERLSVHESLRGNAIDSTEGVLIRFELANVVQEMGTLKESERWYRQAFSMKRLWPENVPMIF